MAFVKSVSRDQIFLLYETVLLPEYGRSGKMPQNIIHAVSGSAGEQEDAHG